jgi:hypothetical protein
MFLRHPISRRGFLLGTSLAASQALPAPATSNPLPPPADPVPPPNSGEPAEIKMQANVQDLGVTWTFNQPQPVAYSCLGDPVVIQQSGARLVSTNPASATITGGFDHGVVKNPFSTGGSQGAGTEQGWDPRYETSPGTTQRVPYDASLNIDPAKTGQPILLEEATFVKAVRRSNRSGNQGHVERYSYLTVVNHHPPAGFFRPPVAKTSKETRWKESDVNYNVLRNLANVADMIDWATAEENTHPRQFRNGWRGEQLRTLDTDNQPNWKTQEGSTYNAQQGQHRAYAYLKLHTAATPAQKREVMLRLIQAGLDRLGEQEKGWPGRSGEGQHHCYLFPCYLAAFALGSRDLLDKAQAIRANLYQMGFIAESSIGYAPGWPTNGSGDQRRWNGWVAPEFLGLPWLNTNGRPRWPRQTFAPTTTQRYLGVASGTNILELFAICLLQNGPGGISGAQAWLNAYGGNGEINETNDQLAGIWFMDLYPLWQYMLNANTITSWSRNFIAQNRNVIGVPRPTHLPPLRFETHTNSVEGLLSATSGGFSYNISSTRWALPERPVTRQDIRYSQDGGVQFVERMNVAATGSFSGLTVSQHLVQVRNWNVNGQMGWSDNYQYSDLSWSTHQGLRMAVTPTGNPAVAAPRQIDAPKLYVPRMPTTTQPDYAEAPDPLLPSQVVLAAGGGYFSGHPAPQRQYRKLRNGVPVGNGAWQDGHRFNIELEDLGQRVSVGVRVFNSAGEVFATTNAVTVPVVADLPPDVNFESGFGPEFRLWYPQVWNSISTSSGAEAIHEPYTLIPYSVAVGDNEEEVYESPNGRLIGVKTASNPRIDVNFAARKPLQPGKRYLVEMDLPIGLTSGRSNVSGTFASPLRVSVGKSQGGIHYDYVEIPPQPTGRLERYSKVITVPAGEKELSLFVRLQISTSTGGLSGGSPQWSWVRITETN